MSETTILLKVLLKQRHLQGHRAFCREYDRAAKKVDPSLIGGYPSKAQFYRWISGELLGLPYADHCRILENMFPNWSAEQLFKPYLGGMDFIPEPTPTQPVAQAAPTVRSELAGLTAAYTSRSEFHHHMPPHKLFDGARSIRMVGLSLNLLCQQYPDRDLIDLIENGTEVDCLFLDPAGEAIRRRGAEEGHPDTLLSTLTDVNIGAMRRVALKLTPDASPRLRLHVYDETIRFNITIVDDALCVVQPYLPDGRGLESPTLVAERGETPGLYETFSQVFESLWTRSREVTA
ncbi:DUF5919 domain-containing protein [Actinokineospora auranticolor]|uniref:DUF5919 domain-containing protein n=1 Tax=Actinokineospora auranticolor TaxID=155976 RepID=A0A2S6GYL5_9PSEU|nr:DUF5919 domain-containing protein [Actinokineospora auranticolor]PPK70257.1 hypothetical protein CLV40_102168 [Actinokineospora auranticolor]